MSIKSSNLHIAWARLLMQSLVAAGVKNVVLSPGSRSTPLALAVAELEAQGKIFCNVIVDERSAAFFALGQVRVTQFPTVLICTSGTAAAHYFPAIIEASSTYLPMIILTADRPWELYDVAAPQTIDQVRLFGHYTRHYAELGLPDPSPTALRAVVRIATQSVHYALSPTPGPVHINARFRKPLEPVEVLGEEPWEQEYHKQIRSLETYKSMHASLDTPIRTESTSFNHALHILFDACQKYSKGLIVCGPSQSFHEQAQASIAALSQVTGFPIVAESTSQMRLGIKQYDCVVLSSFDFWMRALKTEWNPELILQFGMPPISAGYQAYQSKLSHVERYVIASHGWNDPDQTATALFQFDPYYFATALAQKMQNTSHATHLWAQTLQHIDNETSLQIQATIEHFNQTSNTYTECSIAALLIEALPACSTLIIGNSNPVRDLDLYTKPTSKYIRVLHQRGACGIDGLISGAAGTCSVLQKNENKPVAVLLGDLSALHDMNGLYASHSIRGPFVVIVIQNQGGRIFDQLPIRTQLPNSTTFERFFTTPQSIDFEAAAHSAHMNYIRAQSSDQLRNAIVLACTNTSRTLIEVIVDPNTTRELRHSIAEKVSHHLSHWTSFTT